MKIELKGKITAYESDTTPTDYLATYQEKWSLKEEMGIFVHQASGFKDGERVKITIESVSQETK